jgi:hypothetical protein
MIPDRPRLRKQRRPRPAATRAQTFASGGSNDRSFGSLGAAARVVAAARAFTEGDGYLTGQVVDRRA